MRRRYDLRRSDNYPYQGRKAYNCTGDGLITINTGFPVTSALITWASVPVGDDYAESMSSSSTFGTSSSSSSWDITPQLPICFARSSGTDPTFDIFGGQYHYNGNNIYLNENGLAWVGASGPSWYASPISYWGQDASDAYVANEGLIGFNGNSGSNPADPYPDVYVGYNLSMDYQAFTVNLCPYSSSSSPTESSDSSSTLGNSSSSSSKESSSSSSSTGHQYVCMTQNVFDFGGYDAWNGQYVYDEDSGKYYHVSGSYEIQYYSGAWYLCVFGDSDPATSYLSGFAFISAGGIIDSSWTTASTADAFASAYCPPYSSSSENYSQSSSSSSTSLNNSSSSSSKDSSSTSSKDSSSSTWVSLTSSSSSVEYSSSSSSKDSSSSSTLSSDSSSTNEYYGPFTKPRIYVFDYLSNGFRVKYENIPEEIGYVEFSYLAF